MLKLHLGDQVIVYDRDAMLAAYRDLTADAVTAITSLRSYRC
jgi:hypothetical protein